MRRKVIFNLSEHDATQLLALIKKELNQEDRIWEPYWNRLAHTVEQAIEHASRGDTFRYTSFFKDTPDN